MDKDLDRCFAMAAEMQSSVDENGLGRPSRQHDVEPLTLFDALVTDDVLREATRALFEDGHFAQSVRQGFVCLDNAVRNRTGSDRTGSSLMNWAFSADNPRLKLNLAQSMSDRDEQRGYMQLYAGAMLGVRNPRTHEASITDDVDSAIELLVLANHLMRRLGSARLSCPKASDAVG